MATKKTAKKAPAKKAAAKKKPVKKAAAKKTPANPPSRKAPARQEKVVAEIIPIKKIEIVEMVDTPVATSQAPDNAPIPLVVETEQSKRSAGWDLFEKLHRLYRSFTEAVADAVAEVSGQMTYRSRYISASFQPRPLQPQVSNSSFDLLTKNEMTLSVLPDE